MVNRTTNEWDGHIREFPKIKVDQFTGNALAFFLTHAHTDHLAGLDGENFRGVIYATHSTKMQVLRMVKRRSGGLKFEHLSRQATWRTLKVNEPTIVREYQGDHSDTKLVVTALDANHCPGGVMFLLERGDTSVLVTGDTRAERWFVDSLIRNPHLEKYTSGKQLGTIYADTTFSYREHDKFIEFPDNYESVSRMLKYLPEYRPHTHFMSYIPSTGMEMVICRLIDQLESIHGEVKIHLGKLFGKIYESMADVDSRARRIVDHMTHNPLEAKLHFCYRQDGCPIFDIPDTVFIKPVIAMSPKLVEIFNSWGEPSIQEYEAYYKLQKSEESRYEGDLEANLQRGDGDITQTKDGRVFIRGRHPQKKLPRILRFHFSRHSSYAETRDLIARFKPRSVFPLWNNRIAFASGHTMKRLFGEVCHPESRFDYDTDMLNSAAALFDMDSSILIPFFRQKPFVLRRELSTIYDLWALETHKPETTWDHITGFILRYLATEAGDQELDKSAVSPAAQSSPIKQLDYEESDEEVGCQRSEGRWNISELLRLQQTTTSVDSSEIQTTQPVPDSFVDSIRSESTTDKDKPQKQEKGMCVAQLASNADEAPAMPRSSTLEDEERKQTAAVSDKQTNSQVTTENSDIELVDVLVRSPLYRAFEHKGASIGHMSAPSHVSKESTAFPSLIRKSVKRARPVSQTSPTPTRKRSLTEIGTCSPLPMAHLKSSFAGSADESIEPFL